jgi:hypothetical protein
MSCRYYDAGPEYRDSLSLFIVHFSFSSGHDYSRFEFCRKYVIVRISFERPFVLNNQAEKETQKPERITAFLEWIPSKSGSGITPNGYQ